MQGFSNDVATNTLFREITSYFNDRFPNFAKNMKLNLDLFLIINLHHEISKTVLLKAYYKMILRLITL